MTYLISHNGGRTMGRSRSQSARISHDSIYTNEVNDRDENDTTLDDLLAHNKFIFVKHSYLTRPFFQGATQVYQLMDNKGTTIFFGKELSASPPTTSTNKHGEDVNIHILDLNGLDLLLMEGHRGPPRTVSPVRELKFTVYHNSPKGPELLGDIIEKKMRCTGLSSFLVRGRDMENVACIKLSEESQQARGSWCKHWCGFSQVDDDKVSFDIFKGRQVGTRIGGIGLIAQFFPEIATQLNNCVGVELHPDMLCRHQLLLMAAIFIRGIPPNSQEEESIYRSIDDGIQNVEYRIEMNSGDENFIVREVKTSTGDLEEGEGEEENLIIQN